MAYQLIYTSAPRSLEAGRSGFGTVARHRAISPLLVSAIERASQFSRLPGTDANRVIFCHRILTVAGTRFHVLSVIRDAGADYTGRTNHIAHHLIIDPREVAQLGAACPSPAEILMTMPWATHWTDAPRFLADSEAVSLSTFPSNISSNAWANLTGSPHQAMQLTTGDASRGAYILYDAATDLRSIFAESLRFTPDRLWQISFTTSLQPSDEISDFRWIGVEDRSPLRTQAETSGRVLLNLTNPASLPVLEFVPTVQPAPPVAAQESPDSFTAYSAPAGVFQSHQPLHDPASALAPREETRGHSTASAYRQQPSFTPPQRAKPRQPNYLRAAAIIFALLAVAGVAVQIKNHKQQQFEEKIDSLVNRWTDDYRVVADQLKQAAIENGPSSRETALQIASIAADALKAAKNLEFEKIRDVLRERDSLRENKRAIQINFPEKLNSLLTKLDEYLRDNDKLNLINSDSAVSTLNEIENIWPWPEGKHSGIAGNGGKNDEILENVQKSITQLANKKRASLVENRLSGEACPPEPLKDFKDYLFLKRATEKSNLLTPFDRSIELLEIWEKTEKLANSPKKENSKELEKEKLNPDLPAWLKQKVDDCIAKGKVLEKPVAAATASNATPTPPPAAAPKPREPNYILYLEDWKKKSLEIRELKFDGQEPPRWEFTLTAGNAPPVRVNNSKKFQFSKSFNDDKNYFEIKNGLLTIQDDTLKELQYGFTLRACKQDEQRPQFELQAKANKSETQGNQEDLIHEGTHIDLSDAVRQKYRGYRLLVSRGEAPPAAKIDLREERKKDEDDIKLRREKLSEISEEEKRKKQETPNVPALDQKESKKIEALKNSLKMLSPPEKKILNQKFPMEPKLFPNKDMPSDPIDINWETKDEILNILIELHNKPKENERDIINKIPEISVVKKIKTHQKNKADAQKKFYDDVNEFLAKKQEDKNKIEAEIENIRGRTPDDSTLPSGTYFVYAEAPPGFRPVRLLRIDIAATPSK